MPTLHAGAESGPSLIAGTGLVARQPVTAGAVVVVFDGDIVGEDDLAPVNHSCEPNLRWIDDRTLAAIRDIATGEELTTDYALRLDDPDYVLFCHCETYRCRQAIEGTDWRIPQLRSRYAGLWAPAVQHRIDTEAPAAG